MLNLNNFDLFIVTVTITGLLSLKKPSVCFINFGVHSAFWLYLPPTLNLDITVKSIKCISLKEKQLASIKMYSWLNLCVLHIDSYSPGNNARLAYMLPEGSVDQAPSDTESKLGKILHDKYVYLSITLNLS